MKTLREFCFEESDAFPPERLAKLDVALQADHHAGMPWYLRVVVGFGAWVSSLFFLGSAIALVGWDHPNQTFIGILGLLLLAGAVAVGRQKWGIFAEQASLAVSLAAQGMIYVGIDDNTSGHPLRTAMFLSLALAAILYAVFPSLLSRFITCLAALQITLFWIEYGDIDYASTHIHSPVMASCLALGWWTLHLAGIGWIMPQPRRAPDLTPLGYAMIASLAFWCVREIFFFWLGARDIDLNTAYILWAAGNLRIALLGLTLLGVSVWAAGGAAAVRRNPAPFLALVLAVAALIYLGLGGVLLALLFVVLGFALQDGFILVLGLILFPVFLSHYYYSLRLDLLQKSGVLLASGAVVLALRAGLLRWTSGVARAGEAA